MNKKLFGALIGLGMVAGSAIAAVPAVAAGTLGLEPIVVNVQSNGIATIIDGTCPMHEQYGQVTKVSADEDTHLTLSADDDGSFSVFVFGSGPTVTQNITCTYYNGQSDSEEVVVTADDQVGPQAKLSSASGAYQAKVGQDMVIEVTGFTPNTEVTFTMYSEPTELGKVTTDANGSAKFTVKAPAGKGLGYHWITGTEEGTGKVSIVHMMLTADDAPVTVTPKTKKPGTPRTGA